MTVWTFDKLRQVLKTHSNPSTLDGFFRKSYSKGSADLKVDDGAREFLAKVSTGGRDRDNEIVNPKGIDWKNYEKNPVILWSHKYDEPAIGRSLWVKRWTEKKGANTTPIGIMSKGVVAQGVSKAEDVFSLMQQGILKTVSIGFVPVKGHQPTADDIKTNRDLKDINYVHDEVAMLEYSIVNVPSNPEATIDAVSKGSIEIPITLQQDLGIYVPITDVTKKKSTPYMQTAVDGIEAGWTRSVEADIANFDNLLLMCAWADDDNLEFKRSYKFLHHRADNGNPLVWAGLTEAMSRLQTFTEVIPEDDRHGVWKHLAKHYNEFGKEPPELASKAVSFALGSIPLSSIEARLPVVAQEPVIVESIVAREVMEVKHAKDSPELIKKKAIELYEIKHLGRV